MPSNATPVSLVVHVSPAGIGCWGATEQLWNAFHNCSVAPQHPINARELWEQMNTCSRLNLILACIVYWQGREISRVLSQCDPVANGIDLSLLEHVSPIEWDNVVLYGQ